MKPGTYRLTCDLPAFEPDKRKRYDWRAAPMKAGTLVYVVTMPSHNDDVTGTLRAFTGQWSHVNVPAALFPTAALIPVDETPSMWMAREHSGEWGATGILDVLVASGKVTLDDIKAAYAAWESAF